MSSLWGVVAAIAITVVSALGGIWTALYAKHQKMLEERNHPSRLHSSPSEVAEVRQAFKEQAFRNLGWPLPNTKAKGIWQKRQLELMEAATRDVRNIKGGVYTPDEAADRLWKVQTEMEYIELMAGKRK